MNGLFDLVILLRAKLLRHTDAGTDGQPEKEVDNQVDQRSAGPDGSKRSLPRLRRIASPTPDHNRVGGVEQQLEYARCNQREREQNDFREQRA